jgi:ribosomal protein S18 acetylase RimI-like enzyme
LSQVSGTMGLAALGLRAPAAARAVSRKVPVKGLARVAAHEDKATRWSNTLGVTAIGVGSANSFNWAGQQKLERKKDPAPVAKAHRLPDGSWARLRVKRKIAGSQSTAVEAMRGQKNIGYMQVAGRASARGQIAMVETLPEYRRQGVASAMLRRAESAGLEPKHDWDHMSEDGARWARSVAKGFVRQYRDHLSPEAEAGYKHLRSERREAQATAAGQATMAGLSGWLTHHEVKQQPRNRAALAVTGASTLAAGYAALGSARVAGRRKKSMKKIEAKAHARAQAGLYGPGRSLAPVDATSARAKKYATGGQ